MPSDESERGGFRTFGLPGCFYALRIFYLIFKTVNLKELHVLLCRRYKR